jgi:hypothetical protein
VSDLTGGWRRRRTACIVDQNIDRAVCAFRLGDKLFHIATVSQIERYRYHAAYGLPYIRNQPINCADVDIGKRDTRALFCQRHGNGAAESTADTKHQRNLVFQSLVYFYPLAL